MPLRNPRCIASPPVSTRSRRRLFQAFDLLGLTDPRGVRRFPCTLKVSYSQLGHPGVVHNAFTLDISTRGLRLATPRPLLPSTALVLQLPLQEEVRPTLGHVVYVLPPQQEREGWVSGVVFARALTTEQLDALAASGG